VLAGPLIAAMANALAQTLGGEQFIELRRRGHHRQHGAAGGERLHQPPPRRHQAQRVRQAENARQTGRRILADAVPSR
jgi:hypothetical protein